MSKFVFGCIAPALLLCSGEALAQGLEVAPAFADFGRVAVSTQKAQPFLIRNTGMARVTVAKAALVGPNGAQFAVKGLVAPILIDPGKVFQFEVSFSPPAVGAYSGTLEFSSDDPRARLLRVPLDGIGVLAGLSVNPTTVNFPQGKPGIPSSPASIRVKNVGEAPLAVANISLTGANPNQFRFDDPGLFMLQPGQERDVLVLYFCVSPGAHSASLVITPSGLPPVSVKLNATCTAPPLPPPPDLATPRPGDLSEAPIPFAPQSGCSVSPIDGGRDLSPAPALLGLLAATFVFARRRGLRARNR